MKQTCTSRLPALLLAVGILAAGLSGCSDPGTGDPTSTPTLTPTSTADVTPTVTPTATEPPEEDKYMKLTEKGQKLYNATYATMVDRTTESGYAPTSLTGAYSGMFVRDASIQVMAHVAAGDMDYAETLLRYMTGYHAALGAEHTVHIMGDLTPDAYYDSILGDMQKVVQNKSIVQDVCGTGLYKIVMPSNKTAQTFVPTFDTVGQIDVWLQVSATEGELVLQLGEDKDDGSLGECRRTISKSETGWISFVFPEPIDVEAGETYVFTLWAENANGNVVAFGTTGGSVPFSYNYDKPAYNGWVKTGNALGFAVREKNATDVAKTADDEYLTKYAKAATEIGGSTVKLAVPDTVPAGAFVTGADLLLAKKAGAENGTYTVALLCNGKEVGSVTRPLADLATGAARVSFSFPLPIFETEGGDAYELAVSAEGGTLLAYGESAGKPALRIGCRNVKAMSEKEQVDGNYMFVNAFALFAEENGNAAFVKEAYPVIRRLADYYLTNGYLDEETGLLYDPNYEHSRNGRYWACYDLITNCFAAEAWHRLAALADTLGETADAKRYADAADTLSDAINSELTYKYNGKTIYTELIALDEDGKVYPGFSYVSLAPIAADWYAADEEIVKNTYEAYLACSEKYGPYDMLPVVVELDEDDELVSKGNHVIGKGLAWEVYYLWKTGNVERANKMLKFIDERSTETYPEVWINSGKVNDSANQEQASWMLYEIARVTGKYKH